MIRLVLLEIWRGGSNWPPIPPSKATLGKPSLVTVKIHGIICYDINVTFLLLPAVNYYHKALHHGCCSSPRSASGLKSILPWENRLKAFFIFMWRNSLLKFVKFEFRHVSSFSYFWKKMVIFRSKYSDSFTQYCFYGIFVCFPLHMTVIAKSL